MVGQFAAEAGLLAATERQPRVALDDGVDEGGAAFHALGKAFAAHRVARPHAAAQAKAGVIGHVQRLGLVLDPDHCGHRPEQFLVVRRHPRPDLIEHRGRIAGMRAGNRLAADQHACALGHAGLHLLVQFVAQVGAGHRRQRGTTLIRIAVLALARRLNEATGEFIGHSVNHDEALGCDASLPAIVEA